MIHLHRVWLGCWMCVLLLNSLQCAMGFEPPSTGRQVPWNAQWSPPADEYTREKVLGLLRELRASQYQDRQRAFIQLWQAPSSIQPFLEEFSEHGDLQCTTSAKWLKLLRKLGGAPGDASESLVNLALVRVGDFSTLMRLAADHRWPQIVVLLELLDDEQRLNLFETSDDLSELFAMALADRQETLLPLLVDRLYPPVTARAARRLWKEVGFEYEEIAPLPLTDPAARIYELEWDGKVDEAIALALENQLPIVANFIRYRSFRWHDFLNAEPFPPQASSLKHIDQLRLAVSRSLFYEWTDNPQRAQQWRDAVVQAASQDFAHHEIAPCLMALGELDKGLSHWREISPRTAFEAYQLRGDIDAMLDTAGIDIMNWKFDEWLEAKAKELRSNDRDGAHDFGILSEVSHLLFRLGLRQEAEKLESMLEKYAERNQSEEMHATELLKVWSENSRRRRATAYLTKFLEKKFKLKSFNRDIRPQFESMMTIVYPSFQGAACRLLFILREREPEASWNALFDQLESLYHGSLPEGWRAKDFESFAWQVHNPAIDDDLSSTQVANVMATLGRELGFPTLAIALLRASPQYASTIQSIAEVRAEVGDYEGAIRMIDSYPNFLPTDLELQMHRVKWLEQLGRDDEAKLVKRNALCVPQEAVAMITVSEELKACGWTDDSAKLLRLAWRLVVPEDEELASLSSRLAFQIADTEPLFASDLFRLTQCVMMSDSYRFGVRPSLQVLQQFREFESRACHFANEGRFDEADRWVERAFRWLPDNIDTALKLVPIADSHDEQAYAEKWFQLFYDHHKRHLERWPEDAAFHNNLAWLCAKLDRSLDEALSHAEKACYLQPNDPTYMDTLAETLFRTGQIDRAVEVSAACLKLDAKDVHHRQQLIRFSQAQRDSKNAEK